MEEGLSPLSETELHQLRAHGLADLSQMSERELEAWLVRLRKTAKGLPESDRMVLGYIDIISAELAERRKRGGTS